MALGTRSSAYFPDAHMQNGRKAQIYKDEYESENSSESYTMPCNGYHYAKLDRICYELNYGEMQVKTIAQKDGKRINSFLNLLYDHRLVQHLK